MWNSKGTINWENLDRGLIDEWYSRAKRTHGVEKFIYSYILLNHYYAAYKPEARDRDGMISLSELPELQKHWAKFCILTEVKNNSIDLPLKNRWDKDVPRGRSGSGFTAANLSLKEYLEVIYQVRCDLFHASHGTLGYRNEKAILFVAEPTFILVTYLIGETKPKTLASASR